MVFTVILIKGMCMHDIRCVCVCVCVCVCQVQCAVKQFFFSFSFYYFLWPINTFLQCIKQTTTSLSTAGDVGAGTLVSVVGGENTHHPSYGGSGTGW